MIASETPVVDSRLIEVVHLLTVTKGFRKFDGKLCTSSLYSNFVLQGLAIECLVLLVLDIVCFIEAFEGTFRDRYTERSFD